MSASVELGQQVLAHANKIMNYKEPYDIEMCGNYGHWWWKWNKNMYYITMERNIQKFE